MNKFIKCFKKTSWLAWMIDLDEFRYLYDALIRPALISIAIVLAIIFITYLTFLILNLFGFTFFILSVILVSVCTNIDWTYFDNCDD